MSFPMSSGSYNTKQQVTFRNDENERANLRESHKIRGSRQDFLN